MSRTFVLITSSLVLAVAACGGSSSGSGDAAIDSPPSVDGVATADGAVLADAPLVDARVLPVGMLEARPYLSEADSPFTGLTFPSYFHLEDFEDRAVNTPGLSADSASFGNDFGTLVDSVDGDDGTIDDMCPTGSCDSIFGGGQVTFTFDAVALGALPTHVGVVWTDGGTGCDVTFEAFDTEGTSLGATTATAVGDDSNTGTTAEDRFLGIVAPAGVASFRISNSTGGTEADHVQYGR